MAGVRKDTARALPKAPQPPLSHPGATPDTDRARKPPLSDPSATDEELNPGDRVEGLGNFGKPTGEFGTVERANEEDAVVKWDDDGRMRLGQPWLKKVLSASASRPLPQSGGLTNTDLHRAFLGVDRLYPRQVVAIRSKTWPVDFALLLCGASFRYARVLPKPACQ
jgi:hypothetical protein